MIRNSLFALLTLAAPLAAKDLALSLPIDCTLGETCFVQHYVDRNIGPTHNDYTCGNRSYDGHKGTDFALPSLATITAGINVLAAADGVVVAIRNDMVDHLQGTDHAPDITDKECGNGVLIKHGEGWETQYCHLKMDSIIVTNGQKINQGEVLGQVGLSGKTQFPHLHLSVRKDTIVIDPYDADQTLTCDGTDRHSLWQADIPYVGAGVISLGFSQNIPKYGAVKAGTAHSPTLPTNAPALVLWAYAYGGKTGDILKLQISGPNGELIRHQAPLKKSQAQFFRATGKRNKGNGWPEGHYIGAVKLIRDGQELGQAEVPLLVQ